MMLRILTVAALASTAIPSRAQIPAPPEPLREMRAAWVASVYNIDWPSRAGAEPDDQKAELIKLLDFASSIGLNAVILQVRPAGDALYPSDIEPWSGFLTGRTGLAPTPLWDPLEFAVKEAHSRGLELHAWFNPFRARAGAYEPAGNHIAVQHPDWVVKYGKELWMNPAIPGVRARAIEVITDVTRRYDVDGVHIDDYFYPYPTKNGAGEKVPFPDAEDYAAYQAQGGALELFDWRRANINDFIHHLYESVKAAKRWVKVGVSPFGTWRPGVPSSIGGELDAYQDLAADAPVWMQKGWLDYSAPQLYWPISPPELSYTTLLDWWMEQNTAGRHLWPGLACDRIGKDRQASEIQNQIGESRLRNSRAPAGQMLWGFGSLRKDNGGIAEALRGSTYRETALPPASPWLGNEKLPAPKVSITRVNGKAVVSWGLADPLQARSIRWWVVQVYRDGQWQTYRPLPASTQSTAWPVGAGAIAIRGAGQSWVLGAAMPMLAP